LNDYVIYLEEDWKEEQIPEEYRVERE
jgi:hypothetical protein